MRTRTRTLAAAISSLAVVAALAATVPAQAAGGPDVAPQPAHAHWADGAPLTGRSGAAPGQVVRDYLSTHGVGASAAGLQVSASWSSGKLSFLRLTQTVHGLRVPATDVKAVFADGALVSVVENAASVGGAVQPASVTADDALRATVADLYPGRSVSTAGARRSGNVTTYSVQGFSAAPTVEKVALPTTAGRAAVGYVVTTWDTDNVLTMTTVDGSGAMVDREVRTNSESYNVFPEDPASGRQTLVTDPADTAFSPLGWLDGDQWSNHISGNNANAYLDTDNDNAPDANATPVTDAIFGTAWDGTAQPSTPDNQAVAVQNLFYLNNLIHDVLAKAGFTEGAGNFQETNYTGAGMGGDPVQAEAQDGGGTDNANFATPPDGQDPRMQMYLWSPPTSHQVVVGNKTYDATGASWGAQLDGTGVTGPLVVANDGTGTTTDACESLPATTPGAIVIADRGSCNFTVKALNAQNAGAAGIIIANNVAGSPVPMGGSDRRVSIPGVMVSQRDGATVKRAAGQTVTIRATDALLKDASLDSDVVWHEYGHGLTWRMIGRMDDALAGAIGEGMSDVLSVIVNDDPIVGEYSSSDPDGIRSHSYEGYPGTYGDITGTEVHADGELYGAIGWDLWKQYKRAKLGRDDILKDLVSGMPYTPASPTYEDMRDGILKGLTGNGLDDRACMVWSSFAKYGVGVGATGTVRGKKVVVTESFDLPSDCG